MVWRLEQGFIYDEYSDDTYVKWIFLDSLNWGSLRWLEGKCYMVPFLSLRSAYYVEWLSSFTSYDAWRKVHYVEPKIQFWASITVFFSNAIKSDIKHISNRITFSYPSRLRFSYPYSFTELDEVYPDLIAIFPNAILRRLTRYSYNDKRGLLLQNLYRWRPPTQYIAEW